MDKHYAQGSSKRTYAPVSGMAENFKAAIRAKGFSDESLRPLEKMRLNSEQINHRFGKARKMAGDNGRA